ncbi:MAG: monofunctional biosynthetic peptidoglycan transglycosylase [Thiotrichaceae bacterium]|nr:monofunctional biosynthetic peptidoglycan transglycosylase [Thiotrichaceae bacterium]
MIKKILWFFSAVIILSLLLTVSLDFFNPPVWMWKIQRSLNPPAHYPQKVHHQWVSWGHIANNMKLAVIASEDQLYARHHGFDLQAIHKAFNSNLQGKRVRGASTISQQTAKNLFLWPSKNILRKGIEAWFTLCMELLLSKQRILEIYLNIIEFGPGIFGVEAASQYYFYKPAAQLTQKQAARLAAVLPNPYRFHVKQPSAYIKKRIVWIEKQMRQLGMAELQKIITKS